MAATSACDVDVRVVAATNRDLEKMMLSGDFREDLYYRLRVIELVVPSLRERRDEIPTLLGLVHLPVFTKVQAVRPTDQPELRRLFLEYEWPGNIRELENMIKRLVILQDEQVVFTEIERSMRRAVPSARAVAVRGCRGRRGGRWRAPAGHRLPVARPRRNVRRPRRPFEAPEPDQRRAGPEPADESGGLAGGGRQGGRHEGRTGDHRENPRVRCTGTAERRRRFSASATRRS